MGSFPSQEQTVYPSGAIEHDTTSAATAAATATGRIHVQHPPTQPTTTASRARMRQVLNKKLTRGKLLFLGLDGAGKTTLIDHLLRSLDDGEHMNIPSTSTEGGESTSTDGNDHKIFPNPTKTLQSWSYRLDSDRYLQILDLPGRRDNRAKWYTSSLAPTETAAYISGSSAGSAVGGSSNNHHALPLLGVVFVIDASDHVRFPVVAEELVRYQKLKERKKAFQRAQFFLLLNKSDRAAPVALRRKDNSGDKDGNHHQLQAANVHAYRAAMRRVRRELRKCVDHQLRMDQKRHPNEYPHPSASVSASISNLYQRSLSPTGPEMPPPPGIATAIPSGSMKAIDSATVMMMASILECNAHDRESIRAIHAWIKDEIKKVL